MGVSRNITIKVNTKIETSFELIEKFLVGFWINFNTSSINTFYEDVTDNDILPQPIQLNELEIIFKSRAVQNKINTISFFVESLGEGLILSIINIESLISEEKKFEIWISPGGNHTLKESDRNTDFSCYLNLIVSRLKEIDCFPFEIKCEDY